MRTNTPVCASSINSLFNNLVSSFLIFLSEDHQAIAISKTPLPMARKLSLTNVSNSLSLISRQSFMFILLISLRWGLTL